MSSNVHRRMFLVKGAAANTWAVVAEGFEECHLFESEALALAYAGLWAASHPPSQVILRHGTGIASFVRDFG